MNKTFKKFRDQTNALDNAVRVVESIRAKELPKEAKLIIEKTLTELKSIKLVSPEPINVSGDLLEVEHIKKILEDETEYKWKMYSDKEAKDIFGIGRNYTPANFVLENFGFKVDSSEVRFFSFYRNAIGRSELCAFDFVCIPGHFQCNWATDRVSTGTKLMKNEELKKIF